MEVSCHPAKTVRTEKPRPSITDPNAETGDAIIGTTDNVNNVARESMGFGTWGDYHQARDETSRTPHAHAQRGRLDYEATTDGV